MSDKLLALVAEFRYWRAAVPAGIAIGCCLLLVAIRKWPEIVRPDSVFSNELTVVARWLGGSGRWGVVLIALFLAGGAWCAFGTAVIHGLQRWMLGGIPLDKDREEWSFVQRLLCPISKWDLSILQGRMRGVKEYQDLDRVDRTGVYRSLLAEVLGDPHSALDRSRSESQSTFRTLTDARLTVGLFPWLPMSIWLLASQVTNKYSDLVAILQWGAGGVGACLLLAIGAHARVTAGLLLREASTAEGLARHARGAVNSGRARTEVENANDAFD